MKHFAAVTAIPDRRVVGAMSVDDAAPDPYTPEMLAEMDPPAVEAVETATRARPRKDKLDTNDNVIPDPDTVEADRVTREDTFFNEAKLKAAFLAMMDAVNVRLTTAGLPLMDGPELLAAYKARRGH